VTGIRLNLPQENVTELNIDNTQTVTQTHTTLRATCVATDRIYALHAGDSA